MKKLTSEEFIKKAKAKHGDKYDYSKTVYIKNRDKIIITCRNHGDFIQVASEHTAGSQCPLCAKESLKKTTKQCVIDFKIQHGDDYDYSLVNYIGCNDPVNIICHKKYPNGEEHGIFKKTPTSHIVGAGCPVCYETTRLCKPKSQERCIDDFIEVHGDKYDYSEVEYKGDSIKVKIICKILEHGDFYMTPSSHIQKQGCPKCGKENGILSRTKSQEQFIREAVEIHGDHYDYSDVAYVNSDTKVIIKCKVEGHPPFKQTPRSHINVKQGCAICGREKANKTTMNTQTEFIERSKLKHDNRYDYSNTIYNGAHETVKISCQEHGEFETKAYIHIIGKGHCPLCKPTLQSSVEFELLKEYEGFYIEHGSREIISPKEIDLYFPDYEVAIEVDGIYWHSDISHTPKHKTYHLDKTIGCEKQNIQLLHFWDTEIEDKKDIVVSVINSKLGIIKNRIYARKCIIQEVNLDIARMFLDKNHMQGGSSIGTIRYGLYYKDELVSLMTFGKSRFNNRYDWEIIRFCNKLNTTVVGGASKLFKHANLDSVISYANRRWSNGNLYRQLGFVHLHNSDPNFSYTNGNIILSRYKCQKYKLSNLLKDKFNPEESGAENMKRCGFGKIYDCGNMVFGYIK